MRAAIVKLPPGTASPVSATNPPIRASTHAMLRWQDLHPGQGEADLEYAALTGPIIPAAIVQTLCGRRAPHERADDVQTYTISPDRNGIIVSVKTRWTWQIVTVLRMGLAQTTFLRAHYPAEPEERPATATSTPTTGAPATTKSKALVDRLLRADDMLVADLGNGCPHAAILLRLVAQLRQDLSALEQPPGGDHD